MWKKSSSTSTASDKVHSSSTISKQPVTVTKAEDELEPQTSFEVSVVSPNGVTKKVVGTDIVEVEEAVQAVKKELPVVELDINNPAHGNLTDEERQAL